MRGNGKVFISHAHDDNARCAPLLAALDAWGVDYWFDMRRLGAGDDLSASIQRAIAERDVFIRVCTLAAQQSYWVRLETGAFRGLQARRHREGRDASLTLINVILDARYEPEPFDYAHLFIDATNRPEAEWLDELRRALELPASPAKEEHLPKQAFHAQGELVVDATGAGDYSSIGPAIQAAADGATILVRPGHYMEELTIERPLTLRGDGSREQIVIEGSHGATVTCGAGRGRIEGLTLAQRGARNLDCVAITGGAWEIVNCDISTQTEGACVNISSAEPVLLRGNQIHDGGGWGVFVAGQGVVTLEDNVIASHAYSGVTVTGEGYVIAKRNRIARNAQHAVRVYAEAGGVFEENDLQGNYLETWNIHPSSFGKVQRIRNRG